jgi:hypothetical protein
MLNTTNFKYRAAMSLSTGCGWAWYPMLVIPPTGEAEISRITVQGQPGEKRYQDSISNKKSRMVACACHHDYAGGYR